MENRISADFYKDMDKFATKDIRKILGLEILDPISFSKKYFESKVQDISVDPNANVGGKSPNNYLAELAKPYSKIVFLEKLFEHGKKFFNDFSLDEYYNGLIYIHNTTKLQPYCFGTSVGEIATEGRPYGYLYAGPPKRLESFMGQVTEFVMDNSQQFAGAVAITDLVPWMAYFVEKDKYDDKQIENIFQSFVHVVNNSFRVGGDSPFTNVSVNSQMVYDDIFSHYVFPNDKTIKDLWPIIERIQKIIVEFMGKGQNNGLPYRFPILTANFKSHPNEMKTKWFEYVAKQNHKGFMNVNFAERFSMCCRLSLSWDYKQNSFGGGGVKVGSACVVNINLPMVARRAKAKPGDLWENYQHELDHAINKGITYLTAYSGVFKEEIDNGFLMFFKLGWYHPNMFFYTVGFNGIYDAAAFLYESMEDRIVCMEKIVDFFVYKTKDHSNGIKFNVEEIPSETAAGTLAKMTHYWFPEETKQYYSNQFIPLSKEFPLKKRIEIESRLQSKLTGGGMTFLNFDAPLSPEQSLEIHQYIMKKGFHGQFCINYGYSSCGEHTVIGKMEKCPQCQKPMEFYTRVVGYLSRLGQVAESKRLEILDRASYHNL